MKHWISGDMVEHFSMRRNQPKLGSQLYECNPKSTRKGRLYTNGHRDVATHLVHSSASLILRQPFFWFGFCCCDKHHHEKQLGDGSYFSTGSQVTVRRRGKSGQEVKQKPWGTKETLLTGSLLDSFSIHLRPVCLSNGLPTVGGGGPMSVRNPDNSPQANLMWAITQLRVPLPR